MLFRLRVMPSLRGSVVERSPVRFLAWIPGGGCAGGSRMMFLSLSKRKNKKQKTFLAQLVSSGVNVIFFILHNLSLLGHLQILPHVQSCPRQPSDSGSLSTQIDSAPQAGGTTLAQGSAVTGTPCSPHGPLATGSPVSCMLQLPLSGFLMSPSPEILCVAHSREEAQGQWSGGCVQRPSCGRGYGRLWF